MRPVCRISSWYVINECIKVETLPAGAAPRAVHGWGHRVATGRYIVSRGALMVTDGHAVLDAGLRSAVSGNDCMLSLHEPVAVTST